jgi:dihydrofolate reductase
MIEIALIAAVADNGVIGQGGTMPWRLKSDMRHFRALTTDKPVVMGRKTWASVPIKPLPRRTNIVVTRDPAFTARGVLVASSLEAALRAARGDALRRGADAIMVIGGGEIYAQAMPFAHRLEITRIHASPQGDARFPAIDPDLWSESACESHAAGPDDDAAFDFVTYLKKGRQTPGD